MISNPYLPSPTAAAAWAEGFVRGLSGPAFSADPPAELAPFEATAYAQGMLVGQDGAINGLVLADPCVSAQGESDDGAVDHAGHVIDAVHILHGLWHARHLAKLAGGLAGIAVGFIGLACTLPVFVRPPGFRCVG